MSTPQDTFETVAGAELEGVSGGYSQALFSAMQQAVSMGMTINSTTTGGHAHTKGRAFDSIGTPHQMQSFYNSAAQNTHPHELIHKRQFLKDGHRHAPIGGYDGHVHFSI